MKPSEATPLTGARKAWSSSEAATSEAWSSSEAATSSEKQEPATWSWTPRHLAAILFSAALSVGIAIPLTLWLTNCDARIDEARVEIEMSAPYEVWLCASFDTATPDRNVIWSYWDGQGVSPDFSPISASWQLWAPNFTVRMLGPQSARCFLPDIDFTRVKEVRLFTDLLRLRLLQKYGGVWLDSTVLLTAPLNIGAKGFRAEYRPELQMHGAPDFVESWMLVADKDEYIVSAWAELLERLIVLNGGVTAGISSADVYEPRFSATDMFEKLEHSGIIFDSNMREYLVVYVAFTYLCHTDDVFRDRVANSTLIDTSTSGYLVQMRYSWDDHAWMDVLRAPLGSRPEHAEMLQAGHVKLSTQSPGIVELLAEPFFSVELPPVWTDACAAATPPVFSGRDAALLKASRKRYGGDIVTIQPVTAADAKAAADAEAGLPPAAPPTAPGPVVVSDSPEKKKKKKAIATVSTHEIGEGPIGLTIAEEAGGRLVVATVAEGGQAAAAGIVVGGTLLAIGEQLISGLGRKELEELIGRASRPLVMRIQAPTTKAKAAERRRGESSTVPPVVSPNAAAHDGGRPDGSASLDSKFGSSASLRTGSDEWDED